MPSTRLFYYKSAPKRAAVEFLLPIAMKKHRAIEPSMLQDLRQGKPCEIDAINGVVCRQYNQGTMRLTRRDFPICCVVGLEIR